MGALTLPDNTYVDFNGVTQPTNHINAGDVLSFVVSAGGTNSSIGAAAGTLSIILYLTKR